MVDTAAQYALYFVWRLCRADRDRRFGEFRAISILVAIEVIVAVGLVDLMLGPTLFETSNKTLAVVGLPVILVSVLYFSNELKRVEYHRRFRAFSARKRLIADAATVSVFVAALILAFVGLS